MKPHDRGSAHPPPPTDTQLLYDTSASNGRSERSDVQHEMRFPNCVKDTVEQRNGWLKRKLYHAETGAILPSHKPIQHPVCSIPGNGDEATVAPRSRQVRRRRTIPEFKVIFQPILEMSHLY